MAERLLFGKLPVSLFVPLAAPLAELYAAVLLRVFAETQLHQEPLSWELCVTLISELIEEQESSEPHAQSGAAEESGVDDFERDYAQNVRERATELLRNLKQYQWLREEIQSDGTLIYSLPENAFRLLRVFDEISSDQEEHLQGVICNVHDLLRAAVREGNASVRVPQALQETRRLLSRLKELQHTIGLHIEQILQQKTLKDILEQTFITYLLQVSRSSYHELRTTDHVSRFRLEIYQAISDLRQRYQNGTALLYNEALPAQRLLDNLEEIQDRFNQLDDLLQAIDLRHSQFFDAAVRSIQLKLSAATRTSGHLYTILQEIMRTQDNAAIQEDTATPNLDSLILLHSLELLDERSLMAPRRQAEPFVPPLEESQPPSAEEMEAARQATLFRLSRAYSRERIRHFAESVLGEQEAQRIGELALGGPEQLPLLIYLRLYGKDGKLGYRVEELQAAAWIEQGEIGFRDFLIRRVPAETHE